MRNKWDLLTITLILSLGSISTLIIFSINQDLAQNQLIFWASGLAIFFLIANLNLLNWQKLALPFYIFSIIFLIILMFIGEPVRNSIRWIDLGAFRFQPSEIAKIASILILASFFSEKQSKNLKILLLSFLIILPAFILTFRQPDIGNALTFIAIWLGIITVSGIRLKYLFISLVTTIIIIFFGFQLLAPYQKERITSFLNPNADPLGTGYHVIQSKIAVGSGKLLGQGLGRGTQSQLNFLPEAESDFIFASIAEQLGFFGAGLIVILFSALILRILNYAKKEERFGQLVIAGTVSFLLFQFSVNVGMNLGLIPITGITLPLISYGGSSLISTLILLGIVSALVKNHDRIES